jgi:hypothetical protein
MSGDESHQVIAEVDALAGRGRCSPTPAAAAAGGPSTPDVLAALPKSAHPGALAVLKESYRAEDIDTTRVAITALEIDYGAK